jgi:hypothetical protein
MAFNGSGVFLRVMNWSNDALANIKIRADRHDLEDDNLADGLTNCITKDGQTTPTANIKLGGFKLINVGNATLAQDAATAIQVQSGILDYTADSGTASTYVINPSIAVTAYVTGQYYRVKIANTSTGASTLNVSGLGAKAIKINGQDTIAGSLVAGQIIGFTYDGTNMEASSVGGNVTGQSSSVDSEIALFSGTGGKTIKRATGTGYVKVTSGVIGTPAATVPLTDLATQAANTILAEITGSTAAPTAVAVAANKFLARSSSGNIAAKDITDFALTLLDDSTASAARTTLGITGTGGFTTNSSVATTSGTSVSSSGTVTIPSTATQVIMHFNGISTNGSSVPIIQIGDSGGLETTGYTQRGGYSTAGSSGTTGFVTSDNWNATDTLYGSITFSKVGTDIWSAVGIFAILGQNKMAHCGGIKTLSTTLDRVGITTTGGTDTFDAGSFYVTYI